AEGEAALAQAIKSVRTRGGICIGHRPPASRPSGARSPPCPAGGQGRALEPRDEVLKRDGRPAASEPAQLSLPPIRSGRTRGGDHRESAWEESGRRHERRGIPEHPCLTKVVFALLCNCSCTIATRDEGAAPQRPRYDRRIPVGWSR